MKKIPQKFPLILALMLLSLGVTHLSSASTWTTDYQAALDQARAQKKLVLLSFMGDDAYGYDKLMEDQVLTQSPFTTYANKTYVLVSVDLATNSAAPESVKQQNEALARQFHVDGFPTLVVVGADGKEIGRQSGYDTSEGPNGVILKLKSFNQ